MRPDALVLLNPAARQGTAVSRYEDVRAVVDERFAASVVHTDLEGDWETAVARALANQTRLFVAAGGDGTVHAMVNALQRHRGAVPWSALTLGAIGLGSSNDFHKPVRRREAGLPVRLDHRDASPRDLVEVQWLDPSGSEETRLFVVSASVGITATANGFFNRGDRLLRMLQRRWLGLAIVYAALRTIVTWRNLPARLRVGDQEHQVALANLSVLKTPFLSGSFEYDTPVEPADGRVAVNLCADIGTLRLIALLLSLARGRFLGRPGTRHWRVADVEISLDSPTHLELDGEVVQARWAHFHVLSEKVLLCA